MSEPGDVADLLPQFEEVVDQEKAEGDAVRMLKGEFDLQDFIDQIAGARVARVARGSGRGERDVARLLERFALMREVMTKIGRLTGLAAERPGSKGPA